MLTNSGSDSLVPPLWVGYFTYQSEELDDIALELNIRHRNRLKFKASIMAMSEVMTKHNSAELFIR